MVSRRTSVLIESAALLVLLFVAWCVVPTFTLRPWDFETYLLAARAMQAGLDPYNPRALEIVAHRPVGMPFLYPPITIPFFLPFLRMSLPQAAAVWLGVRVAAFLFLFQIWRRQFLPTVPSLFLIPTAAFAFNGSVIWDLRTGNVTVFQDLLLWLGFAAFVQGRRVLASAGILAASVFKLIPAIFLVLLLLRTKDQRSSWRIVLVSLLCFAVLIFGPSIMIVGWSPGLLHGLAFRGPWGVTNPSVLNLINSVVIQARGWPLAESANLLLWLCYVAMLLLVSIPALHRAWKSKEPTLWIMTLTPLFVLLNPRPVAYGYFLAVPAIFTVISEALGTWRWATVAIAICAQGVAGAFVQYKDPWTSNLAFIVLLALWLLYVRWCARPVQGDVDPRSVPAGPRRGPSSSQPERDSEEGYVRGAR